MRRWSQPRLVLEVALLQLLPEVGTAAGTDALLQPPVGGVPTAPSRPVARAALPKGDLRAPLGGKHPTSVSDADVPTASGHSTTTEGTTPAPAGTPSMEPAAPVWSAVMQAVGGSSPIALGVLQQADFLGVTDGILRLRFPTAAQAGIADRWRATLEQAWRRLGGQPLRVEYTSGGVAASSPARPRVERRPVAEDLPAPLPEDPPPDMEHGPHAAAGPRMRGGGSPTTTPRAQMAAVDDAAFRRALSILEGTPLPDLPPAAG